MWTADHSFTAARGTESGRCACIILLLVGLAACSQEQTTAATVAPMPPSHSESELPREEVLESEIVADGVPTRYRAVFDDGQLKRVITTRGGVAGEYEFYGARLMRYVGASSARESSVELQFDLQGRMTSSRAGTGAIPAEEISAIRTRAGLLRSHALTQRSVRAHR